MRTKAVDKLRAPEVPQHLSCQFQGRAVVKSSFCATNACVEVLFDPTYVYVFRHSAQDESMAFTHEEWAAFVKGVKNNEFDVDVPIDSPEAAPDTEMGAESDDR